MSRIIEARDCANAGEFATAAELYLQEANDVLESTPRSEWSYEGIEAIGWALRAEFEATRAGEDALSSAGMYTVLSVVVPFRADVEANLDETDYQVDQRGLLAYLAEWEGDAYCYRDRPEAAGAYRRALDRFEWIVEEGGDPRGRVRIGWSGEPGADIAFYAFDEYLDWRDESWPESERNPQYMVAALDRLEAKLSLVECEK